MNGTDTDMERHNPGKKTLSRFGKSIGVIFLVITGLIFLRHGRAAAMPGFAVSGVFLLMGLLMPVLLKPFYIFWMYFSFVLAWVNTKVMLILIFYMVFTPIGLLMRAFRIDPMERKRKQTYWKKKKTEFSPLNYERRF